MTEKELDKILTSVLGQKPNVSGKPEKRSAKKSAEAKKPEKEKKKPAGIDSLNDLFGIPKNSETEVIMILTPHITEAGKSPAIYSTELI